MPYTAKSYITGRLQRPIHSVKAFAICDTGASKGDESNRDTIITFRGVEGRPRAQHLIKNTARTAHNPRKAAYARTDSQQQFAHDRQ